MPGRRWGHQPRRSPGDTVLTSSHGSHSKKALERLAFGREQTRFNLWKVKEETKRTPGAALAPVETQGGRVMAPAGAQSAKYKRSILSADQSRNAPCCRRNTCECA